MDPDATLEKIRSLAEHILTGMAGDDYGYLEDLAEELSESAMDLDDWLREGGFLPAAWER